ncbi:hypothetical protein D3C73_1018700 [compost metagenome]
MLLDMEEKFRKVINMIPNPNPIAAPWIPNLEVKITIAATSKIFVMIMFHIAVVALPSPRSMACRGASK